MPPPRGLLRHAQIKLHSYHHNWINECCNEIHEVGAKMGIRMSGIIPLPTKIRKMSFLRSPFVHSKAIVQVCGSRARSSEAA